MVERQFGASIQQEALEKVIGDAYKEAVAKEGLEPITQASVSNLEYKPGEDVHFDVDFEVRPQVDLVRLGGFQLKREKRAVGEAEIERVVERLREEKAIWEPVDAEQQPATGEMVSVEITPFDDEGAPQETKTRPYQIILGRGEAAPEVETAIQSLAPGGETEFTIAHPAEEGHEGHSHRARVRLKEIKRPRYPEVDDDLAKAVGDFDTVTEMRARIRTDLEREAEQDAETEVRRQLVEQIIDANPFEVPDGMVTQYLERLLPAREGSNPERVAEARQGMVPGAQRALRRRLVIERVAELESLQATPSEIEARLEDLAQR